MSRSPIIVAVLLGIVAAAAVLSAGSPLASGAPIAAGAEHSCAVTPEGGVQCWGANDHGQLGNGTSSPDPLMNPVDVIGLSSTVDSVATGATFSCALSTSGGVRCWGRNNAGQLGDGTTADRTSAVQVSGLTGGVAAITAGQAHACALLNGGGVQCWGSNGFGQLGNGSDTGTEQMPVDVVLPEGASQVAAGALFTCALTAPGGVKCWGDNIYGQIGDGTMEDRPLPTQVSGLEGGVSAIGAGGGSSFGHACAAMAAGGAKCWGNNEYGQLGENREQCDPRPPQFEICWTPLDVGGLSAQLQTISGGILHTCALTTGGAAKCWGHNQLGQIGDDLDCGILCGLPQDVIGLSSGATALATGSSHNCATVATGIKCWGDNSNGQLGDGGECGTSCAIAVDVVSGSPTTNGDLNCDEGVNSIDAALVLQLSAGLLGAAPCNDAADVNHDGSVNAIDAALILQFSAGLLSALP